MSNVLQQIAVVHRDRVSRKEKERTRYLRKLQQQRAYFKDSGIMEMWEDVKDIIIKNPVSHRIEGITIPLSALFDPTHEDNIQQTGLALLNKNNGVAQWTIEDHSNYKEDQPKIFYCANDGKIAFCLPHDQKDVKKKFCAAFVKWLAQHITAQMIVEMGIEIAPAADTVRKRSRKILQLAE